MIRYDNVMKNHHKHNQNLILFGYKGSGKSLFGKLLAEKLQIKFIDTDLLIEKSYEEKFSIQASCREISVKLGESGFRQLESEIVHDLDMETKAIIAVGGGTLLNMANFYKLKETGKLVYLEVSKEIIKKRIFESGIPSFLDEKDPEYSFEKMYEERKPLYEKIEAFKIKIDEKSTEEIMDILKIHHDDL